MKVARSVLRGLLLRKGEWLLDLKDKSALIIFLPINLGGQYKNIMVLFTQYFLLIVELSWQTL